jgi:ComF family protein
VSAGRSTGSSGCGATPNVTSSATKRTHDAIVGAANALLAVVLAPACAACARVLERPLDGPVCAVCWASVSRLTPRLFSTTLIDRGRSAGDYEGTLRHIVHAFKYDGRRTLGAPLGTLLREAGGELLQDASCVVPVPLHPWRRLHRGFNQAADLAATLPLPVVHALWRRRITAPQTGLTAGARRRNVRGAFRLSPLVSRRVVHSLLADRTVVLVDDVRTTGATLDACAHVLKHAGAKEVRALTVAQAPPPPRLRRGRRDPQ